jgi:hypothetical protein
MMQLCGHPRVQPQRLLVPRFVLGLPHYFLHARPQPMHISTIIIIVINSRILIINIWREYTSSYIRVIE